MHIGRIVAFLLVVMLAGCKTAPPSKPTPTPMSAAERQQAALHSLGFQKTEDGWLLNLPEPISFELNRDELRVSVKQSIAQTAGELIKANVRHLRIEGHTDNSGPRDYNIALSLRRAQTVAHEFVGNGFAESDIIEQGLGPDSPISSNETREARALNRCVIIIIPVDALAQ